MANLKRSYIELVKNPEEVMKGGEPELEKFWTPPFIPFSKVRQAMQMQADFSKNKKITEYEITETLSEFIAKDIFNNQFTVDDLYERLHAPDAMEALQNLLFFVTNGGKEDETKKFVEKNK